MISIIRFDLILITSFWRLIWFDYQVSNQIKSNHLSHWSILTSLAWIWEGRKGKRLICWYGNIRPDVIRYILYQMLVRAGVLRLLNCCTVFFVFMKIQYRFINCICIYIILDPTYSVTLISPGIYHVACHVPSLANVILRCYKLCIRWSLLWFTLYLAKYNTFVVV